MNESYLKPERLGATLKSPMIGLHPASSTSTMDGQTSSLVTFLKFGIADFRQADGGAI